MSSDAPIEFTYFPRLRDPQGERVRTTWRKLVSRLSRPNVSASKHDVGGISLATFRGRLVPDPRDPRRVIHIAKRSKATVERVFAVGLDLDHLDAVSIRSARAPGEIVHAHDWDRLIARFDASDAFLHTTWSSTDEALRVRVFVRLSRPVTGDEYADVYDECARIVESAGIVVDRAASDPSRFWFLPSVRPGAAYRYSVGGGRPVDVERALASAAVRRPIPVPVAPRVARTSSGDAGDVEMRAAAYLDRHEIAVSGQGGHRTTFLAAQRIARGFDLDDETTFRLLSVWNARCRPPWSERELRRKIAQAREKGTIEYGSLRDRDRRAA